MAILNIHEAKTHFSELVERVRAGEEIVIARSGKPVARLVPYEAEGAGRRELGAMRGQIWMAEDFDAPLPPDVLAGFSGGVSRAARDR
jgi:prevent-host-death family protein